MKKLILVFIIAASPASAQSFYSNSQNGNSTYYQGSNGYNGYAYHQGNQTYYQDNRGHNCYTQRYGSQSTTDCY